MSARRSVNLGTSDRFGAKACDLLSICSSSSTTAVNVWGNVMNLFAVLVYNGGVASRARISPEDDPILPTRPFNTLNILVKVGMPCKRIRRWLSRFYGIQAFSYRVAA